ncbi:putative diphthamide synthesis protein [Trypanosoma theileri]|uniref:2-(3-amino-3-carboxypropyl)histidine synthase subunit 1 n=1 Tax=Trypanosoma theileri TaxID=67003 RepID=A0A1X0P135_9TRYP|nr:putative diphthamide synthesis protein [Trypanosoma theileri]ORC90239.1 putative diphthamide synthesis protein [Trypanosoma theileri]
MTSPDEAELGLPGNYRFEIEKSVKRIKEKNATRVALQFPEGLLMFAAPIADILEARTGAEMVILGDVTYGACCVDDYSAAALGCDFLIHYGHSCLISIKDCLINSMMYVFVEIDIDVQHFVDTIKHLVPPETRVACIATIQFVSSMRAGMLLLKDYFQHPVIIPQNKPLSSGEILGCTSPMVDPTAVDLVLYVGDGRFHLESFLIAHPTLDALQYDPYKKTLTKESYNTTEMRTLRREAIQKGMAATSFALIMGTLGRQGNPRVVDRIVQLAERQGKTVNILLMSEIFPQKLATLQDIDCYIQVACPRLSIDWGYAFDKPLLSPYEAEVALGGTTWSDTFYPMDHYSKSGGRWAVYTDKSL